MNDVFGASAMRTGATMRTGGLSLLGGGALFGDPPFILAQLSAMYRQHTKQLTIKQVICKVSNHPL